MGVAKRRLTILCIVVATVLPCAAVTLFVPTRNGPLVGWDHRFDECQAHRPHPDQIIARLGRPDYDPRWEGWRSAEMDGPLYLGYWGRLGKTYKIMFDRNGRVERLDRLIK